MPFYSPLRYPGGKRKLAGYFKAVIKANGLCDGYYVEPYAGGAAIALELLFEEYISHIHINDLDPSVHAFWYAVLNHTEELCAMVLGTSITMTEWHRQKQVQASRDAVSLLDLGFSTLYLNRTNRSGIIKGGVIGGRDQTGPYKLDARFNREDIVCRIRRIGRYRGRISLTKCDGADLLSERLALEPDKCLVYLDPPYYVKGRGLYTSFYEHEDHMRVADAVRNCGLHWIVTYDNVPPIREMYDGLPALVYDLHYSAADRYRGREVLFASPSLWTPEVDSPARLDPEIVLCG